MPADESHEPKHAAAPGLFLTTRWSRVILAGDSSAADAHEALASLCRDYWRPLYHFARQKGHSPEGAQDLTSEGAITVAMHRMRRRYGELLREEIAATVATPEEVEDELRHLMNVVSGSPTR